MSLAERWLGRWFQPLVERTVRERLAVIEDDNTFLVGTRRLDDSPRDRLNPDREPVLEACLDAWRSDPLARRLVDLTSG